jgi:hypothetical protein
VNAIFARNGIIQVHGAPAGYEKNVPHASIG